MSDPIPRYAQVRDRALRRRAAAIGALALVPGMTLAACADGDSALRTDQSSGSAVTTTMIAPTTSIADSTTTIADSTTSSVSGAHIASGSELVVDFTYEAASSAGRVNNPYIAVWVEDEDGELVQTLSVWYLQSQKGTRWLSDLRRWTTVDGSDDLLETVSGATRSPGDYSLAWDGTDLDGELVSSGTYYVVIEAAREDGPYSLVREPVELGSTGFSTVLAGSGELAAVAVTFDVA